MRSRQGCLPSPLVIAHRGASAVLPEHTLAAYERAIEDGADVIEPDLVATRDGMLVARHENEISGTTDIAGRPEYAARKTAKIIDGVLVKGWFTEDFTLAELKTLRARERIPHHRPESAAYDGCFDIPALEEIIDLAQRCSGMGRTIGIYPETKHPGYFRSIGLALEPRLVEILHARGYRDRQAPVYIQSFEVANLRALAGMTDLPLVQLLSASGQPNDFRLARDRRGYRDMATPAGLRAIASYACGIGPAKDMVIPRREDGRLGVVSALVHDAHAAGLLVHPYTFRPENIFLPLEFRRGDHGSLTQHGDLAAEISAFLDAGIDGLFTDAPGIGRTAVDARMKR